MRAVLTAVALCALAACAPPAPAPAPRPAAPPEPTAADFRARYAKAITSATADKSTPEAALRSWWAAQDAIHQINCDAAVYPRKASEPWSKAHAQPLSDMRTAMLTGEAETMFGRIAALQDTPCIRYTFDRVIQSTRHQGDDRTVIVVLAHNTTPLPDGLKLREFRSRQRRDGVRYRYTLLKRDDGWRISAIETNPYALGWSNLTDPKREYEGSGYSEAIP